MVSTRCKMIVKAELRNIGVEQSIVELGEVELNTNLTETQNEDLKLNLLSLS